MRLAWFTPLSKRTGISKYSFSAVKALSNHVDIDVWTIGTPDNLILNGIPVHEASLNDVNIKKLRLYDAVIYNMGNNLEFHFVIFEFYKKVRGVVILHDKIMHHFSAGYLLEKLRSPGRYVSTMNYFYGDKGKKAAERSLKSLPPVWETVEVSDYPLFEPILCNSIGVVVHSRETYDLIFGKTGLSPLTWIYHPFHMINSEQKGTPSLSKNDLGLPEDKIILLSTGNINSTKRIDSVLRVIGKNRYIRGRVHFVITGDGHTGYLNHLRALISEHSLSNFVSFTGFIDDHNLYSYIKNADICINLRYPSTESLSYSLIEQLYLEKPD
jgi:glycosyltransferase involved in cell wall biosynthesis